MTKETTAKVTSKKTAEPLSPKHEPLQEVEVEFTYRFMMTTDDIFGEKLKLRRTAQQALDKLESDTRDYYAIPKSEDVPAYDYFKTLYEEYDIYERNSKLGEFSKNNLSEMELTVRDMP